MYIGPWQEYKLARLIQEHNGGNEQRRSRNLSHGSRSASANRVGPRDNGDDIASVASSSRSGFSNFSTQSAPAQLAAQASAQSRLTEFYEHVDRASNERIAGNRNRLPAVPRPRSSSGAGAKSSASRKPPSGMGAKASGKAKAKSKPQSFQDDRKARILQMQRLYGLANDEADAQEETGTLPSPTMSNYTVHSAVEIESSACPRIARDGSSSQLDRVIPYADQALTKLQASIQSHEPEANGATINLHESWELPTVPEDPFNLTGDLGSSGGLIAWSKNLRPEELSPSASLAAFFPAPF